MPRLRELPSLPPQCTHPAAKPWAALSPAHLGPWHPARFELGLGGSSRKRGAAGSLSFRGKQAALPWEGPRPRLFRHHLPLPPLSSPSVASTAFTTRSCSSNMTPRPPTSCSWCARLETSRKATWWRWCCRVRGRARAGAGPLREPEGGGPRLLLFLVRSPWVPASPGMGTVIVVRTRCGTH